MRHISWENYGSLLCGLELFIPCDSTSIFPTLLIIEAFTALAFHYENRFRVHRHIMPVLAA